MFIKIQYQCFNSDTKKSMVGNELASFIAKKDIAFSKLAKEQGYTLEIADYDFKTGVRELFFVKVINA